VSYLDKPLKTKDQVFISCESQIRYLLFFPFPQFSATEKPMFSGTADPKHPVYIHFKTNEEL